MKIKTIIFSDANNASFPKLENVISNAFGSLTSEGNYSTSVYSTVQSGMPEIAGALRTNNIVVLFADERIYHEAKRSICKAFKFEMIHSVDVLDKLSKMEDHGRYMLHALMPSNATAFALSDGLFPGFAIRSKSQCIFFLPFSEDRSFITIKKYVFPYISRVYGSHLPSFSEHETAYAASILKEKLENAKVQIAIANTPFCKYIAHAFKNIDFFNEYISYAPYDVKKDKGSNGRISAISAAEYYECQFGVCVLEGEKDENGNFTVTINISNRKTAKIRTISSISDETHDDFMTTVVTELFLMLAEEISHTPIMTTEEIKHISPTPAIHGGRIALYIALFAAAFFLTYVSVSFSGLSF